MSMKRRASNRYVSTACWNPRARKSCDKEARSIADIFDVRVAQITFIDAEQRWTMGDSRPLAQSGVELANRVHPRAGSVHARVITANRSLLIHESRGNRGT